MRGAVSMDLPATHTAMQDHKPLFGIGLGAHRLHFATAPVGAIPRIDVHVQAPQAKRAMVARGVAKRLHRLAAMRANKAVIVF